MCVCVKGVGFFCWSDSLHYWNAMLNSFPPGDVAFGSKKIPHPSWRLLWGTWFATVGKRLFNEMNQPSLSTFS